MAWGNVQQPKMCGLCFIVGHPTDMCPLLDDKYFQSLVHDPKQILGSR